MYKNIKLFKKSENLKNKFSQVSIEKKLQNNKLIPLGIDEVIKYADSFPILISTNEQNEFILYAGLVANKNMFTEYKNIEEPNFLKNYPFLMIKAKKDDKLIDIIAYDESEEFIGKDKDISFFNEDKLSNKANEKIQNVKLLATKRNLARILIQELKQKDLLIKQSFNIKINGEEKMILKDYYIVNRTKLCELDDKTISTWAKNGWIGLIDAHIYSLRNFQKIVDIIK